jgi:hypothetical protein
MEPADDAVEWLAKDLVIAIAKGDSTIEHIVTMDDLGSADPRVVTLAALMEKGDSLDDADLDARLDAVKMDDVALSIVKTNALSAERITRHDD